MNLYAAAIEPFMDYAFMRRALAACTALAFGGAPLGVFLVLRRMALVGDAISHAILPGASLAFLAFGLALWPMTLGGIITGLLIALIAGALTRCTQLKEDASFTGMYLISLAAGVMLISLKGSSVDLLHVLFGNVLAVDKQALVLVASIASFSMLALSFIYRGLVVECFDTGFMHAVRGKGAWTHQLFLMLVVLNLVAAFQSLGTLMALGVMVLPAITAGFWTRNIDSAMGFAVGFSFCSSLVGLLLSYHLSVPSGPAIVLTAGGFYIISVLFGQHGSILSRLALRRHYAG